MSLDGYLDDNKKQRLLLSNAEDFDRFDSVRASCDAVFVGANTIRKDNPRLLIRSEKRQKERIKKGLPPHPIKITMSLSGNLDPACAFLSAGDSKKLIYTLSSHTKALESKFGKNAIIIGFEKEELTLPHILANLSTIGVRRLLVEGGTSVLTQFLQAGLVNELQISIAPFFVGEKAAPRFVGYGKFPWNTLHRMNLHSVERLGNIAVLHYNV
mgnify:CR=1 FL=1